MAVYNTAFAVCRSVDAAELLANHPWIRTIGTSVLEKQEPVADANSEADNAQAVQAANDSMVVAEVALEASKSNGTATEIVQAERALADAVIAHKLCLKQLAEEMADKANLQAQVEDAQARAAEKSVSVAQQELARAVQEGDHTVA